MNNWTGIILAASMIAAAYTIVKAYARARRAPPREPVFTLIAATGHGEGLEQLTRSICVRCPAYRVIITDCGLDEYGRKLAELLSRDMGECALVRPEELPRVLEEYGWTKPRGSYR